MTIKQTKLTNRPKLGRSCRCMKIQGRGYESVVDCVSLLFENILKSIQQYQQYLTISDDI